jgi:hypothetical protein
VNFLTAAQRACRKLSQSTLTPPGRSFAYRSHKSGT